MIPAMVKRIVRQIGPRRIILFGSYARGAATQESDVDLLVVVDDVEDARVAAVTIRGMLGGMGAAKDVVVTTPREVARRGRLIGSILESALREGSVLYDRDGDYSAPISAIEAMDVSAAERDAQTRRWLAMARQDVRRAEMLATHADPAGATFHAQVRFVPSKPAA